MSFVMKKGASAVGGVAHHDNAAKNRNTTGSGSFAKRGGPVRRTAYAHPIGGGAFSDTSSSIALPPGDVEEDATMQCVASSAASSVATSPPPQASELADIPSVRRQSDLRFGGQRDPAAWTEMSTPSMKLLRHQQQQQRNTIQEDVLPTCAGATTTTPVPSKKLAAMHTDITLWDSDVADNRRGSITATGGTDAPPPPHNGQHDYEDDNFTATSSIGTFEFSPDQIQRPNNARRTLQQRSHNDVNSSHRQSTPVAGKKQLAAAQLAVGSAKIPQEEAKTTHKIHDDASDGSEIKRGMKDGDEASAPTAALLPYYTKVVMWCAMTIAAAAQVVRQLRAVRWAASAAGRVWQMAAATSWAQKLRALADHFCSRRVDIVVGCVRLSVSSPNPDATQQPHSSSNCAVGKTANSPTSAGAPTQHSCAGRERQQQPHEEGEGSFPSSVAGSAADVRRLRHEVSVLRDALGTVREDVATLGKTFDAFNVAYHTTPPTAVAHNITKKPHNSNH